MARIGQFGLATSPYGQKVATVSPADNNTTMTALQQTQATANAQAQALIDLLNAIRNAPKPATTPPTTTR